MSLGDLARAMPKVELHVHLEGAIQPRTLLALAARRGVDLPARDEAGLREWFRFRDFEHFVEIYLTCSRCLRDPEDFQKLALDFLADQAEQNVLYTEAHFTVATHIANGANGGEIADALWEAIQEGERRYGVRLRLITDIVRNLPEQGDTTLEWALAEKHRSVVALGLSGSEARFPSEPFREHFLEAAKQGLHRVAHAGEHGGADVVRTVVERLGAERIGHGVRVLEDPELVRELADWRVPLEVCPTSNVRLGVAPDLASHPFEKLRAAGLAVTVNSDDPALFNTTLAGEFEGLAEAFGYGPEEIAALALAGLRHSFLAPSERQAWEREFVEQIAELSLRHVGRRIDVG